MAMNIVSAAFLIVIGALGAANLIIAKRPDAEALIEKVRPAQGWLGVVAVLFGAFGLVRILINIVALIKFAPILTVSMLGGSAVTLALGFLLAYPLLDKHVLSANQAAAVKGAAIQAKLAPMQAMLGLAAIALAVWSFVPMFIIF